MALDGTSSQLNYEGHYFCGTLPSDPPNSIKLSYKCNFKGGHFGTPLFS
jgi:hypothetical protein